MKTFTELTKDQQQRNLEDAALGIIDQILEGFLEIEFSHPDNQSAFLRIIDEAAKRDSFSYAQRKIVEHKGMRSEIEKISLIVCSESYYDEDGIMLQQKEEQNEAAVN